MIKGTTPSYVLRMPNSVPFDEIDNVRAIFMSKETKIVKDLGDMELDSDNKSVNLFLTQEETFKLSTGDCTLTVRVHLKNETALATRPISIKVNDIVDKEVIKAYDGT